MKFNLQIEFAEFDKAKELMVGCIKFANMLGANCSIAECEKMFDNAKTMSEAEYYNSPMIRANVNRGTNPGNQQDSFIGLHVEVDQRLIEKIADVIGELGGSFAIPAALHLLGFSKSIKNSFKAISSSISDISKMVEIPEEGIHYLISNKKFPIGDLNVEYTAVWRYDGFNKPYVYYFHCKDDIDRDIEDLIKKMENKNAPSVDKIDLTKEETSNRLKAIGIKADVFGDEKEKEKEECTDSNKVISMDKLEEICDGAGSNEKNPSSWEEFATNIDKKN